jgi:hypothetical protein
VGFLETDFEVEEAAASRALLTGIGVVGLVCEDADGGGRDALIGEESPYIG